MATTELKILVVDDNPEDRETCRRYLTRDTVQEYRIVEQASLEHALEFCREEKPDCILLDYHLNDGNGIEFLHSLQEIGGTRLYPVVMLTGTGSETIAVEAMKAGAQDYLVKGTLTPDVLHRTVANTIYKARTDRLLERKQTELEAAYRAAQEANARKDQFLATLSHELRTPLTPILTAVSALDVSTTSPEELREVFAIIQRNVELEARLIDDLLDLTRIASGKLKIDPRPADVHQVLNHALDTCRESAASSGVTLTVTWDARESRVLADTARLQQVLWNLLSNAIKFTPRGGRIEITTRNAAPGAIEVEVRDSGIGIAAEVLPKVFDAFEQGDPRTTRRYGGLGLGLAIAKALVEAHGGTIRATSEGQDRGSRLILTLATVPTDQPAAGQTSGTVSPQADPARAAAQQTNILVVEDHEDTIRVLRLMLKRWGYRALTASTVAEALEIFQRETVGLIVSDIGLPDASGAELMEQVRALGSTVPGIALSGFGMEHDVQRSRDAGFAEHLVKPVDWQKLEAAILRLLKGDAAPPDDRGS